jgi:hypothetical protein
VKARLSLSMLVASALSLVSFSAQALCLSVDYSGPFWVNDCGFKVWVSWTDNARCGNWSCGDFVPAHSRDSASIGPSVHWSEWTNGQTGRGPC